jgi:hypothetical protein
MTIERINIGADYWIEISGLWTALQGPAGTVFIGKSVAANHPHVRAFAAAMKALHTDTPETQPEPPRPKVVGE